MNLDWDDKAHLLKMTNPYGLKLRNYLIIKYLAIWKEAASKIELSHQKDAAGRFRANTWLREEVEDMQQKYDKPEFLKEYEELVAKGPPQCCHSCDYYRESDGMCLKFREVPPIEFVQASGVCDSWLFRIPF